MRRLNWSAILRKAAQAGRSAILKNYTESSRHKVLGRGKGGDMTLRIDEVSERAVYNSLRRDLGKTFVFLSEEAGEITAPHHSDLPVVVCDPLDGSHNAEVGIPFFSVALSVIENENGNNERTFGNITNSVITSIKTDDEFYARKGGGSFRNGKGLKLVQRNTSHPVNTLLVETSHLEYLRENILSKLSKDDVNKTRLLGSAALSYCMLASGSAEGFVFAQSGGARTIDSPAGYLIASEAGCVFSNLTEGMKNSPIEKVAVGFSSRLNILGAKNTEILSLLQKKLVNLP